VAKRRTRTQREPSWKTKQEWEKGGPQEEEKAPPTTWTAVKR
jgi:hypothetical protein